MEEGFQKFDVSLSSKFTKRTRPPSSPSPKRMDSCFVAADLLFALNRREHREKKRKKKKKCRSPKGPFQTLTLIVYSRVQKVPYF